MFIKLHLICFRKSIVVNSCESSSDIHAFLWMSLPIFMGAFIPLPFSWIWTYRCPKRSKRTAERNEKNRWKRTTISWILQNIFTSKGCTWPILIYVKLFPSFQELMIQCTLGFAFLDNTLWRRQCDKGLKWI